MTGRQLGGQTLHMQVASASVWQVFHTSSALTCELDSLAPLDSVDQEPTRQNEWTTSSIAT